MATEQNKVSEEAVMIWVGSWRNQYGSALEIASEANGRIEGSFRTALKDGSLYGQQPAVISVHQGDLSAMEVRSAVRED